MKASGRAGVDQRGLPDPEVAREIYVKSRCSGLPHGVPLGILSNFNETLLSAILVFMKIRIYFLSSPRDRNPSSVRRDRW